MNLWLRDSIVILLCVSIYPIKVKVRARVDQLLPMEHLLAPQPIGSLKAAILLLAEALQLKTRQYMRQYFINCCLSW